MRIYYLLTFLILSPVFAAPCGLEGSVEERIKSCNLTKGNFALVSLTEKGQEFYKDLKSGLVWGPRIFSEFNNYGSQKACLDEVSGYLKITSIEWRLPSINELELAATHGMKTAFKDMNHAFWSSTLVKAGRKIRRKRTFIASTYIWDALEERTDTGDIKDGASVRCVTRE